MASTEDNVVKDGISEINTKVLIHDSNPEAVKTIRNLCDGQKFVRIKSTDVDVLEFFANPSIFQSDISAIFLCEEPDAQGLTGLHIADRIHKIRGTLPIFLRLDSGERQLNNEHLRLFAGTYSLEEPEKLQRLVNKHLFAVHYPIWLVDLVNNLGRRSIDSLLRDVEIVTTTPALIRDYLTSHCIVGMMPIEIACGKGYLTFKAQEEDFGLLIKGGNTPLSPSSADPQEYEQLVGELVNQMWGGLRQSLAFIENAATPKKIPTAELPIITDFCRRVISFGTNRPQLSFRYLIYRNKGAPVPVVFDFTMLFNVHWNPYCTAPANTQSIEEESNGGDLELF